MYLFRDILAFRNRPAALGFLLLMLACSAHSQTLQGDWKGTLSTPGGDMPCVFHLDAGGSGTLTAQSPVPLQYSTYGSQIKITVPSISGSYAATVNGNEMKGTWTQNNQSLPLTVIRAGAPGPSATDGDSGGSAAGLQGDWKGTLSTPGGGIPCVFHLDAGGSGTLTAQSTVPLQYSANGAQIRITVPSISGTYAATVNGNQMNGTWTQNNQSLPLTVTRAGAPGPGGTGGDTGGNAVGLQGDWKGTLSTPGGDIPCVFHLDSAGGGTLTAQSTVPLQYSVNGSQIRIMVLSINGMYAATVNGNQMNGTWTQNNQSLPLTVTK